jgi:serine/threonine-protein kinase HipA
MSQMSDQLLVYLNMVEIGTLERDALGDMSFSYNKTANQRLSIALPIQSKKFGNQACESFFGGLLPESEKARDIIARKHNANPDNTFSLLKAIGQDCAGAVSLHEPTAPPTEPKALSEIGEELDERSLAEYLRNLPQSPLLLDSGARFSLAGYQDKAAVSIFEGRVYLPKDSPSTHILKPGIKNLEATVQNEFLCLRIAHRLGIPASKVELKIAEEELYLQIERYDRKISKTGIVSRIHQEDFCQALGYTSARKYQNDGGPSFADCFKLIALSCAKPLQDRPLLLKYLIFNFLVLNADAHAKNFSLLHFRPSSVKLAPLYDVLTIPMYGEMEQSMAMSIGGIYEFKAVRPEHWQALSKAIGISFKILRHELAQQTKIIMEAAEEERDALRESNFNTYKADELLLLLQRNCNSVVESFDYAI